MCPSPKLIKMQTMFCLRLNVCEGIFKKDEEGNVKKHGSRSDRVTLKHGSVLAIRQFLSNPSRERL